MLMRVDRGALPPEREHLTDAGLTLRAKEAGMLRVGEKLRVETGVHVRQADGIAWSFAPWPGLLRRGIRARGMIDMGRDGEVLIELSNQSMADVILRRGDRLIQLVAMPMMYEPAEVIRSKPGLRMRYYDKLNK